jgi:hypothetical protein
LPKRRFDCDLGERNRTQFQNIPLILQCRRDPLAQPFRFFNRINQDGGIEKDSHLKPAPPPCSAALINSGSLFLASAT